MTDKEVNATLDDDNDIDQEEDGGDLNIKKLILFVGLPLILLGSGATAYLTGMLDDVMGNGDKVEEVAEYDVEQEQANLSAAFLKIPDMIVNLSGEGAQPRYLRLSVQLELEDEAAKLSVENVMPRVIDQFQTYLRELRVNDLRGSAGIYRLQMELLSRVNAAAYPVEVQDVLFQEILIQ